MLLPLGMLKYNLVAVCVDPRLLV